MNFSFRLREGRVEDIPAISRAYAQSWQSTYRGVAPDVEVEFDPKLVREGKDPQLDKAIEIVTGELAKHPVTHPHRPAFPNYYKPGMKEPAEGM